MDKNDWQYIDIWSKKIRAINHLGGKCKKCGNDNIFQLCFHHFDIKEFNISKIKNNRWSKILKELKKCELLCGNCHQEKHNVLDSKTIKWKNNKKLFLDYKGCDCEKCGYDKYQGSLVFHHINKDDKLFEISKPKIRFIDELDKYIKDELDKCQLLCHNCHNEMNIDKDKFERLKEQIYEKVKNYKELQPKLDRNEVYEMYDSGIKQVDIAKYFDASKGTISGIIKKRYIFINNIFINNQKLPIC